MKVRSWMVFLLSLMFFSVVGIGAVPSRAPASGAYVLLFMAAVIGIVATSMATSALPRPAGLHLPSHARKHAAVNQVP